MNIERVSHSGALIVSDIVNGYRVARTYYGYNMREAARLFRQEVTGYCGACNSPLVWCVCNG